MSIISKDNQLLTLINVFTIAPAKQQQVIDLLIEAMEKTMRHLPGFVSANIHRSFDDAKVVNYAQWRSQADFVAMQQNPEARSHMEAVAALTEFNPILCEVVDSIS